MRQASAGNVFSFDPAVLSCAVLVNLEVVMHSARRNYLLRSIPALMLFGLILHLTSCQSGTAQTQQPDQAPSAPTNIGVWFSANNIGILSTLPASLLQPAPQLSQGGSYMLSGNVSLQATGGGYPTVTCLIQIGTTNFPASITSPQPNLAETVTATGAVTLAATQVPATVSLVCSSNIGGQVSVTQAALSIIQVGTLQTGQ